MKLWAGRFGKDTDTEVDSFNSSLPFDSRLFRQDIIGSVAHAKMLGKIGVLGAEDVKAICEGLGAILEDIESGNIEIGGAEDIHMFVEALLTERIGDAGKRLHTARSRNDQVALDLRLYAGDAISSVVSSIISFQSTLLDMAASHLDTIMPGYTHLQRAQPITLAHHLMAWAEMLRRDVTRFEDARGRLDSMPLGSGALAGTTYPLDRGFVANELGFADISRNSLDAVSDRDFVLETLSCLSILMAHLSRMAEEVILWTSFEFGFAELDDAFATGSSIMPQKKNPDVAELVRGKAGRVFGSLTAMLTVMKGLPLAYNKDMQEDKEGLFDAFDTVTACLSVFPPMVASMTFNPKAMRSAAANGFLNATDAADYLVKKGLPFREAYNIVGRLVRLCAERGRTLETLELKEYRDISPVFSEDVFDAIALETCVGARNVPGGPAPEAVCAHINETKKFIKLHVK